MTYEDIANQLEAELRIVVKLNQRQANRVCTWLRRQYPARTIRQHKIDPYYHEITLTPAVPDNHKWLELCTRRLAASEALKFMLEIGHPHFTRAKEYHGW